MKKKILFLAFVISIFNFQFSVSHAQQVIIKGKYNGKMMTVKAQRAPGGDIIESISYAPLDDLKKEVANLKKQRDELEKKYNEAKANVGNNDGRLSREYRMVEDSLKSVKTRLQEREDQVASLQNSLETMAAQLQQNEAELEKAKKELNDAKLALNNKSEEPDVRTTSEESFVVVRTTDFLGLDVFFGASFITNNLTRQDFWSRPISGAQKYHLTLTHYFSSSSPVALKVGVGLSSFSSQGNFLELRDSETRPDVDGVNSRVNYHYETVSEHVSLSYLDVPILLHFGNNSEGSGIQAWVDAGFSLGLNVAQSCVCNGTYTAESYYSDWNVTIDDVPELEGVSNASLYDPELKFKVNSLVVWANAAIGIYIPLGKKFGFNLGARVDYSLTPLATNSDVNSRYMKGIPNLLGGEATRSFAAGANIGLTYRF